jgi:excisionase family DNA binding protein
VADHPHARVDGGRVVKDNVTQLPPGPPRLTEPLLTVPEAAALIRKSTSWLYKKVAAGKAPVVRIGSNVRFVRASLEAWAFSQQH